jgi:carboxypeptidase C (cathepsin A)
VIYFDSPAGVGYSVCGDESECQFNDDNTADDNLNAFLTLMTERLPQLQKNPLYIAGESYAGIYVPKLALKIDQYITNKSGPYLPNLKGILVGNPVTDHKVDGKPMQFEMAYWYGLIDDALYHNVKNNCNLSYWDFDAGLLSAQCKNWMNSFNSIISGINHYDFLGKCYIQPQPSLKQSFE